jgi:hypothetical protein
MAKPAADQKTNPTQVYTKEKARHLVHVYSATVCGMLLIGWLNLFLVNPLKDDEKEMVSHFRTIFSGLCFLFSLTANINFLRRLTWIPARSERFPFRFDG